ncbi:class I SAM-dependent methyltransferase [Amphiplicatus metriothermophilus]|uniref:Methyltransferase domain-containing protein n=1 Tax=Amphiplicatus metriothermophilus TaxID=1519374 RepID=A0A239PJX3_9PROT|nr:class I SAM-dependent methyltransferase [Amphiplicatus metriothermophilus]MBB5517557.1 SAM-dependent methyltransferase [Amphiplicatus metriothermophilus]SNT68108.1 Methyltransferase domain-containing protein [Amphiplicatus metriothermophilus]
MNVESSPTKGPSPAAKQRLVALARGLGVLPVLEAARFLRAAALSACENRAYLKAHPGFAPPPLWWMHDMYSHASYARYMASGKATAVQIVRRIDAHCPAPRPRVADWGCGLGRVIRHLPERYDRTGFDYNRAAIDWCKAHIRGATFRRNAAAPPLPAEDGAFDALYALSVFTHLSEAGHRAWIAEVARVLAPGGIFLGAFHMTPRAGQLLPGERARFEAGELVVRGRVKEGRRIFTAIHPERYLRERLLAGFDILEGPTPFFDQTLFVARKRPGAPV